MTLQGSATDHIGYLLLHVAEVAHRQSDQALQEQLGVGVAQLRILQMLHHSPGASQRRIADSLGQTEAGVSRQIKLLLDKGLVHVQVDPAERRKRIIDLTPMGVKITDAAAELLSGQWQKICSALNKKQQEAMQQVLDALHDYTCQSGKPGACTKPFELFSVYSNAEP